MAITYGTPRPGNDGNVEVSLEEFKKWLKNFDANKDGRINVEELRAAVKAKGGWFGGWKAQRGVSMADMNSNGAIDDGEISNLVKFAEKHLGFKIISAH